MSANKETLIKRFESTAAHYERTGKREWAYAKNDWGEVCYSFFVRLEKHLIKLKSIDRKRRI